MPLFDFTILYEYQQALNMSIDFCKRVDINIYVGTKFAGQEDL